jgi:hypothetical protein
LSNLHIVIPPNKQYTKTEHAISVLSFDYRIQKRATNVEASASSSTLPINQSLRRLECSRQSTLLYVTNSLMRIQRRSGSAVQYLSSMVCQPQFNLESVTVPVSHGILTSSQEPPDRSLEKLDRASLCRHKSNSLQYSSLLCRPGQAQKHSRSRWSRKQNMFWSSVS